MRRAVPADRPRDPAARTSSLAPGRDENDGTDDEADETECGDSTEQAEEDHSPLTDVLPLRSSGRRMLSTMLIPSTPTSAMTTPAPMSPFNRSQSAAGHQTSAAPTTGTSEQNAVINPQKRRRSDPEQPERDTADEALDRRHEQPRSDAGDDEVAGVTYQAIALRLRKRQEVAQLPAEAVAVTQQEEEGEQHGEQTSERREHIRHHAAHARREERQGPLHALA